MKGNAQKQKRGIKNKSEELRNHHKKMQSHMLPTRLDFEVDITSSDGVELTIQTLFNFFVENPDKFCQDYSIILEDQVGTIIANHFKQHEIKDIMQMFNKIANEAIDRCLPRFTEIGIRIDSARIVQTTHFTTNAERLRRLQNKIFEYNNRIVDMSLINSNYLFNAKTKIDEFFCTMKQEALERVYKSHAMNQQKMDEFDIQLGEARETGCLVESLIVPDLFYRPFAIHMFLSNETNSELVGKIDL